MTTESYPVIEALQRRLGLDERGQARVTEAINEFGERHGRIAVTTVKRTVDSLVEKRVTATFTPSTVDDVTTHVYSRPCDARAEDRGTGEAPDLRIDSVFVDSV